MKANGFTLVELMVGLVIAMLCMIMMLMFFKHHSQVSMSSSRDAQYDAQLRTGMLVMEKLVQNAGFGSGQTDDIGIGTYAGHPALFWRFRPDLTETPIQYSCQGFAEEIVAEGQQFLHRLISLNLSNCGNDTVFNDLSWESSQAILLVKSSDNSPIFEFQLSLGNCRPFGIDEHQSGLMQLLMSARRQHGTGLGESIQSSVCLNNIKAV